MTTKNELFSNIVLDCLKNEENVCLLEHSAIRRFRINHKAACELLSDEKFAITKRGYDTSDYAFFPGNNSSKIIEICSQDLENLTISELLIYYELIRNHIKSETRIISMLESKRSAGREVIDRLGYYRMKKIDDTEREAEILEEIVYRLNINQRKNPNWYLDILKICRDEMIRKQHLDKKTINGENVFIKKR